MFNLKFKSSRKPQNSTTKILNLLKNAGKYGVYNDKLSTISLSYTKRISTLRKQGHKIVLVRLPKGHNKYYFVSTADLPRESER